jgi:murein hydrolase activator
MRVTPFHLLPLVLVVLFAHGAAAQTPIGEQDRLKALEGSMAEAEQRQARLESQANALRDAISVTTRDMVRLVKAIQDREDRLTRLERQIAQLDENRATQLEKLDAQRVEVSELLAVLQTMTRRPPQLVLLKPGDAIDTARSASMLTGVIPALRERTLKLRGEVDALVMLRNRLETERKTYASELSAMKRDRSVLEGLRDKRQTERAGLLSQAASETERAAELAAQANDIRSLLERLEAETEKRERLARLPGPKPRPKDLVVPREPQRPLPSAVTALAPDASEAVATPEVTLSTPTRPVAGQLLPPARGDVIQRFGQITEAGAPAKGMTIRTRASAQVIAPYSGRVVYAGKFRGYGELLIIAHGQGYHTLLAGLERVDGRVGDSVQAGEPLGQMGLNEAGVNPARTPILYMELRLRGEAVDPLPLMQAGLNNSRG